MNILVLEPHATGHHGPYLEWMVRGLVERGFVVDVITSPETAAHPSLRALDCIASYGVANPPRIISSSPSGFSLSRTNGGTGLVMRELSYWRLFNAWYKAHADSVRPDVIFLPYLDYCLYAIGLLGSPFGECPWIGLAMRPSFHYQKMGVIAPQPSLVTIKKALFFRLLNNRSMRRLLTIDEPLAKYLEGTAKVLSKVTFLPEPADLGNLPDTAVAKRHLGFSSERKLILLYGSITERKGALELLRALAAPGFPPNVDVLMAGNIAAPKIRDVLAESWTLALRDQGRLKIMDRFIDTRDEAILFSATDIVWLGYRGHYNGSGVLMQAATAGRPVLACQEGVLGWQTFRHGLGRTADPANTSEVIRAVIDLLNGATLRNTKDDGSELFQPASFSQAQDILALAVTGA